MTSREILETAKCHLSAAYFVSACCRLKDEAAREWRPFALWPAQAGVLAEIHDHRVVAILKARQLGCSWLVIAYCLWAALLHPAQTVLLFSRRDDEAVDLLVNRLREMYQQLPAWLRCRKLAVDNDHEIEFSNGSRIKAFPSQGGDSYTASIVVLDEFDLVTDQDALLASVKPTIDGGGKLIVLSRPDKSRPESAFKRMWRAAPGNGIHPIFLPWHARPDRDQEWYEAIKQEIVARTGGLDDLWQSYPATPEEALAPRQLDKRIPAAWLNQCFRAAGPLAPLSAPSIPGLLIYTPGYPTPGRKYVIGADPAEGNPTSDDSALTVLDQETGEEVASLAGHYDPSVFAGHIAAVSAWYNNAPALVERNNHGHAVLLALRESHRHVRRLHGHDAREGWLSNAKGKALLYSEAADAFRDKQTVLHSRETYTQLASIDGATLRAPEGQHDDRADAYALAIVGQGVAARGVAKAVGLNQQPQKTAPQPMEIVWPSDGQDRW